MGRYLEALLFCPALNVGLSGLPLLGWPAQALGLQDPTYHGLGPDTVSLRSPHPSSYLSLFVCFSGTMTFWRHLISRQKTPPPLSSPLFNDVDTRLRTITSLTNYPKFPKHLGLVFRIVTIGYSFNNHLFQCIECNKSPRMPLHCYHSAKWCINVLTLYEKHPRKTKLFLL